jgi:hypothetical protein
MTKRDIARMTPAQIAQGRALWQKTSQVGRIGGQSANYEETAPKTWIRYMAPKGGEICVIECELYAVPRTSGAVETVGMIVGMCPACGESFMAREDNKSLSLGHIEYQHAPAWLRVHWEHRCKQLGKPPMDADKIPVVSSSERWACDYCKGWCVRVTEGVACDDHKGNLPSLVVSMHTPIIGSSDSTASAAIVEAPETSRKIII